VIAVYVAGALIAAVGVWGLARLLTPVFQPATGALYYTGLAVSVLVWAGLMLTLHRMPAGVKKRVVILMTFAGGLIYVLEFYLPAQNRYIFFWRHSHTNAFSPMIEPIGDAYAVIFGFTLFLGAYNLARVHGRNIAARRPGYHNSIAFFLAFIAMMVFALWQTWAPKQVVIAHLWGIRHLTAADVWGYLFNSTYVPLQATLFSVLAFYMATAAFRAFRVRSAEAGLMMLAAFICMLGQVPLGMWLTHHLPLQGPLSNLRMEAMANWVLGVISMGGLRAVGFGILVGGLAVSLRFWLSLERGAFFEQEL